ncbi:hypothetical protein, partial [Serratia marcescens]|uniref:hypothetical protein n=1 Tax=Serratia marcescens TaxID=615 RepID=UPI003B841639
MGRRAGGRRSKSSPATLGVPFFFLYIPSDFPPDFYLRFIFLWRLPDAAAEKHHYMNSLHRVLRCEQQDNKAIFAELC